MNIIEKLNNKIQVWNHNRKFQSGLVNKDISIISQNCIGGVLYHLYDIPFQSPTINMFIEDENFVKLAENPRHYFSVVPEPITDNYIDPINSNIHYPKILVDDIELCCLHYSNCAEAIEHWQRRKKRINYNNLFVIANSWNLHDNIDLIGRIQNLYMPSIIIDDKHLSGSRIINLKGDIWRRDERGIVRPNITDCSNDGIHRLFELSFDFTEWFNSNLSRK